MKGSILMLLCAVCFLSCKKGEDDPAISLHTRKARLAGNWRVESGNFNFSQDGYKFSYLFNGTELSYNDPWTLGKGKYLFNIIISKNGTFTLSEIITGSIIDAAGTWSFNSGVGETKKKEEVIFYIRQVNKGQTWNGFFNQSCATFKYSIKELRNKKMVLEESGLFYSHDNEPITFGTSYTLIQS
jgi:hypothetical protein